MSEDGDTPLDWLKRVPLRSPNEPRWARRRGYDAIWWTRLTTNIEREAESLRREVGKTGAMRWKELVGRLLYRPIGESLPSLNIVAPHRPTPAMVKAAASVIRSRVSCKQPNRLAREIYWHMLDALAQEACRREGIDVRKPYREPEGEA